ncbi:hypothetical protein [Bacillus andreraoultii]|uniref:hypothetical protein n=1 Tax=Bacillus andreraoultii TaxID=1499685 RepID=UPI0005AB86FA|nr:hypothetical protein [Bacillus andreraoultii]
MPRKPTPITELKNKNSTAKIEEETKQATADNETTAIDDLTRMLADVLTYLSDEEIEEIDIEYLLNHTVGLRAWWEDYCENNRKQIEKEIKQSLYQLSLKQLEHIQKMINDRNK